MSVLKYWDTGTSSWQVAIVGAEGATGAQGASGADGATGASGANGADGATGASGANGADGATGASGANGADGATGASGANGADGATGASGANGADGATGASGANGADGATGASGANGADGATGASGANGADGATGASGANGADGATGASGANGADGATGATGPTGNTGATGSGTGTANKIYNGTSYANIASANSNLQIGVNTNTWNFGSDGNLTLPYNAKVAVSESTTTSGALSLNGSSNYLTLPSSSQWILGTTWTIEFWINADAPSTGFLQRIITQEQDTGVLSYIDINVSDGLLGILCTQNNAVFYTEPTPGVWTHVAIVNNNSADTYLYVYYNGVRQTRDSGYGGPANYGSSNAITIGRFPGSDFQYFPGKLSDIRITSGIAVYTGNFTVPTSVLTVTQPAGTNIAAIPTTASVVLLMGMLSSGTAFNDSSSYNTTITNVGSTFTTSGPGLIGGIGGGIVLESISADGTTYDWQFDTTGNLTLPDTTTITANAEINLVANSTGNITGLSINGDSIANLFAHGNVTIITDSGNTTPTWTFDTTGNLSLPSGGSIYSVGSTPSGAPGNTITLQPAGSGITTNQKLLVYPTAGDGDHIHMTSGNLYETELFLGSDNLYVKLANTGNIVINSNDDAGNTAQWKFSTDGNLTLPNDATISDFGDTASLNVDGSGKYAQLYWNGNIGNGNPDTGGDYYTWAYVGNAGFTVQHENASTSTDNEWKFGIDGNLTLPGNLVINGLTNVFGSNVALLESNPDLPLLSISSGNNGGASSLWVEDIGNIGTSNIAAVYANPTPGSGIVRIAVGQNGGNSGPSLWDFNASGALTLPQGSQISETSNTSVNITANANTWAFGVNGNLTLPNSATIIAPNVNDLTLRVTGQYNICTLLTGGSGYGGGGSSSAISGGTGTGMIVGYGYGLSGQVVNVGVTDPGTGYSEGDVLTMTAGNGGATFVITKYNTAANAGNNNTAPTDWTFGVDGNITLPNNYSSINYANGSPYGGGGNTDWANIGNINNVNGPTEIAIGANAGLTSQGAYSVAVGADAGSNNQGYGGVAVGKGAGATGQGIDATAIGTDAGATDQGGDAVAVGESAGLTTQGSGAVAVGNYAGGNTQGNFAVAIGAGAGETSQGNSAVAIGEYAGQTDQGVNAVAIGEYAGRTSQGNNSIILNATGANLNQTTANTFTVSPVRNDTSNIAEVMFYNATSKEVTYGNTLSVAGNITGAYILGNGSGLTSLPAPTVAQDITSNGAMSIMTYDGNLKYVNYATVEPSSGNIAGNNISASGNIAGVGLNMSGNVTVGGNLTATGGIRKSARVLTTTTTLTVADASGFIEFSPGTGPYTITLPDPTLAANSGIGYRFWQNTTDNITLSTPAGAFYGPSGSTTSTVVLAQATTQYWDVWSDGYNWAVFGIKIA